LPSTARVTDDALAAARQAAAEVFLQLCDHSTTQATMLERGAAAVLHELATSAGPTLVVQKAMSLLSDPKIGGGMQSLQMLAATQPVRS
jgi:hypothetical protein